ncbi:hypothetical protein [Amycolatopsis sp. WQ 127309]|uniref:hypothetical protein n=1 Tax=Amycolatopsis sp. WQ 127309 TaxID=2932773 RepID=UPI001FF3CC3D|nr:hypothetical protein [Amycolatopsis sp. WQ 127309]UOZ03301.1 hypothetical protein MUY22_31140 [Amycolatopsis sp. WQ 127309]
MFPFDQLGRAAHAMAHEAEHAGTALVHTAQDAIGWAGDLFSGDIGARAMPVPAVVQCVMAGDGTSWTESGATSGSAAAEHHEIAAGLTTMLNNLEPAWTGSGADRAHMRTKAFSDLIDRAALTLSSNGSNVTDAAYGFELAKRSMEPMGDPPDKSFFDVATPWDTDTEEAIEAYNAKAEKNLGIYNTYVQHLDTQGQGLSGDYGRLTPEPVTDPAERTQTDLRGVTDRSDRGTGKPARVTTDRTTTETPSTENDHANTGTDGKDSRTTTGSGSGDDVDSRDPHEIVAPQHDQTDAAGLTESGLEPGRRGMIGLGLAEQVGRGAGTQLPDPGDLPLVGVPRPPASAGPNRGLAEGGAGTLAKGPRGGAEQRAAGAGGRGTGSRGAAGVAPAGTTRGSSEDDEHQRKYVRDDASAFAVDDDELVDPHTGFGPVQPTIGT